ncbi:MAG: aminoacyl-tRNA hydrolase, partial [Gammaproteobacteria bacterium]|nr:aminoacyl-tRNA hydrolase [Phycisphaerae bacterium]NIR94292.1 aminoacyl-tRNA hydrolase [Gammaproteobacteria bacterium]NIT52686.1 aminoacyl-tRNA hydrolase [candidate division Zixibacteria bacterium]NIW40878.1 aminoacyl-tRNA hydrolase [candidate division Zixibacteria bacterium]NIX59277.1 aminoacyl-tRNA hydrolase [candidate division Zixibacteria bacterium]
LVCALGNPGKKYEQTRHNAGWLVLDAAGLPLHYEKKFKGIYASHFS